KVTRLIHMKNPMKHVGIAMIASILLNLAVPAGAQPTGSPQPNIVFILVDDVGWGELGTYGNTFNETPQLDRLAAQGIRFTQAGADAPVCWRRRAGMLTGQHPARVGITDFLPGKTDRYLAPEQ